VPKSCRKTSQRRIFWEQEQHVWTALQLTWSSVCIKIRSILNTQHAGGFIEMGSLPVDGLIIGRSRTMRGFHVPHEAGQRGLGYFFTVCISLESNFKARGALAERFQPGTFIACHGRHLMSHLPRSYFIRVRIKCFSRIVS